MKYVVRNEQDLDALLEERIQGIKAEADGSWEWEGHRWYGCDAIVLNTKGRWFDKDMVSPLWIWESYTIDSGDAGINAGHRQNIKYDTKINPEHRQNVKNTIQYIQENFDHIYQVMLEMLLPTLIAWEVTHCKTGEPIATIQQIHDNHDSSVIAGMEAGCITNLQLNCRYQKDDMVYYSFIYCLEPFEDGFEVVFWKDRIVFFGDGNPQDAIFEFDNQYKDYPTHFEID